jgi:hypothetical protein
MTGDLRYNTWQNLLKLTSAHVTDGGLTTLLRSIADTDKLSDLSEDEAANLLAAISPLPALRSMLWEGATEAIEAMNAQLPKGVARLDAPAAAEAIIPYQLDHLAILLVKQHQTSLNLDNTPPAT